MAFIASHPALGHFSESDVAKLRGPIPQSLSLYRPLTAGREELRTQVGESACKKAEEDADCGRAIREPSFYMKTSQVDHKEHNHIHPQTFRRVAGTFASGVTAITTMVEGRPHGCAANAVSSLSLDPPLMLICLAHTSKTHSQLREAGTFAINILDDSSESRALCRSFALRSEDRFIDVDYRVGTNGVPVLDLAMSWMECKLVDAYDAGDHTIFIGRVLAAEDSDRKPLVYFRGKFGSLLADKAT